jgi:hypothetical protein
MTDGPTRSQLRPTRQLIDLSVDVVSRRIRELSDGELMLLEQRLLTLAEPSDANH